MRALSPTEAQELAMMQQLCWSSYAASAASSPVSSPTISTPAAPSITSMGALPLLASTAAAATNTRQQSTSAHTAMLLDHYARMARSRALARSVLELNTAASSIYGRRVVPTKKSAIKTKFSLLSRPHGVVAMPSVMLMKKSSKPMMPLRAPPALPKVTPGQGLLGIKEPVAKKE